MSTALFAPLDGESPRRHAPATERNREPLLAVLARVFPDPAAVLEIASGSGQHAAYFGRHLPHLTWQPSDREPELLASIDAWVSEVGAPNVLPAVHLDVCEGPWLPGPLGGVVCINMIHIAPWEACEALLTGAAAHLAPGGALVLYGPFREGGRHTAESNERFDESLRSRDARWGVRDLDEVCAAARERGLRHEETVRMPANNLTVVLRRQG